MNQLRDLLEGNLSHADAFEDRFDDVQESQEPGVVTVCCSDSRVLQDAMWSNEEPGEVFTCGNIGNRVVQYTESGTALSGDVLYPLLHTGTGLAVVVGHTGCGAVTATYADVVEDIDEPEGVMAAIGLLRPGIEEHVDDLPEDLEESEAVNRLVEMNVDAQVSHLLEGDEVPDDVDVVGVVYDFQDVYPGRRGEVHVINVNGVNDSEALVEEHPELADRVNRLND